jgi:hypothetical protein
MMRILLGIQIKRKLYDNQSSGSSASATFQTSASIKKTLPKTSATTKKPKKTIEKKPKTSKKRVKKVKKWVSSVVQLHHNNVVRSYHIFLTLSLFFSF